MRAEPLPGPTVRPAREGELAQLLELYCHLHPGDPPMPPGDELLVQWRSMCSDPNLVHVVADSDGRLVASCVLAIIPNLTRGARPYALIENVVTHRDHRRRGYGTAVLRFAVDIARSRRCYKVMLLS